MLRPYIEVFFFSLFFFISANRRGRGSSRDPPGGFPRFPSFPPRSLLSATSLFRRLALLPRTSRSSRGGARVVSARRRPRHRGARGGGPAGRVARGPRVPAPAPAAHQRVPADGRGARPEGARGARGDARRAPRGDGRDVPGGDRHRRRRGAAVGGPAAPPAPDAGDDRVRLRLQLRLRVSGVPRRRAARRVSQGTRHGARRAGGVAAGHARDRALARERHRRAPRDGRARPVLPARHGGHRRQDALVVALFALNVEFGVGEPRLSPGSTAKETNVFAKETNVFEDTASVSRALLAPAVSVAAAVASGLALGAALGRAARPRFLFFAVDGAAEAAEAGNPHSPSRSGRCARRRWHSWPVARSRSRRARASSPFCCAWWRARRAPTESTPAARAARDVARGDRRAHAGGQPGLLHRGGELRSLRPSVRGHERVSRRDRAVRSEAVRAVPRRGGGARRAALRRGDRRRRGDPSSTTPRWPRRYGWR